MLGTQNAACQVIAQAAAALSKTHCADGPAHSEAPAPPNWTAQAAWAL
jgi:hypothetical protein